MDFRSWIKNRWFARQKLLVIHAGTHKTATTYIQNRLGANRQLLRDQGVFLLSHGVNKVGRFYRLATILKEKNFHKVKQIFNSVPEDVNQVVLSDERLTMVLIQDELRNGLLKAAKKAGFRLRMVFFLRDQPDYINSLYVQEIKRLYHAQSIHRYTKRCMMKKADRFDYNSMFANLLNQPEIESQFLPFGVGDADPFETFMEAQGWRHAQGWQPASEATINTQPGIKGVWLARMVRRRLEKRRANLKHVRGQSRFVDKYARRNQWMKQRFYGLNQTKVDLIRDFYKSGNDAFAQKVWRKDWDEIYKKPTRNMNMFKLSSLRDRKQKRYMIKLINQVLVDIKRDKPVVFECHS